MIFYLLAAQSRAQNVQTGTHREQGIQVGAKQIHGSISRGPVSTRMEAKQGEAATYLHSQSFVSWHLLKGSAEISADVFTSQVKQDGS